MHILIFDIGFQEKVKNYFLFQRFLHYFFTFYPKNPKRPNRQSAYMAHFVVFCIGFQKNIPLQNPPGGGRGWGYMAAQGLIVRGPFSSFNLPQIDAAGSISKTGNAIIYFL